MLSALMLLRSGIKLMGMRLRVVRNLAIQQISLVLFLSVRIPSCLCMYLVRSRKRLM